MNNLAQDLQLHTIEDDNSINSSSIQSKINNFRNFFAEKTALILDNKANSLLYALGLATAVAAVDVATSKNQNTNHIEHPTVEAQINNQHTTPQIVPEAIIHIKDLQALNILGSVNPDGSISLDRKRIYQQADKYHVDQELLYQAMEDNEQGSTYFKNYISEVEYNQLNLDHSYKQVGEAIGDLATIEGLIEQQTMFPEDRIKVQRIFNELLRSKQKVIVHGSETIKESDKYHLIHEAADYNYQFITGEEYNQESMGNVTHKIDSGEYGEEMLISYARELRDYIHYNAGFDMNQYDSYLASIKDANNTSNMIAQNNNIIEEENY